MKFCTHISLLPADSIATVFLSVLLASAVYIRKDVMHHPNNCLKPRSRFCIKPCGMYVVSLTGTTVPFSCLAHEPVHVVILLSQALARCPSRKPYLLLLQNTGFVAHLSSVITTQRTKSVYPSLFETEFITASFNLVSAPQMIFSIHP